jgi:predicted PurR-regulated permease PerM
MRRTFRGLRLDTVRSASLTGLFLLASFYTCYFAASLILPIYLSVLLSFALAPFVRALRRLWIPAPAGAAIVLVLFIGGILYSLILLTQPATEWIARGPTAFQQVEQRLRFIKQPLAQVTKATESVEQLATVDKQPPTVAVRQASLAETLFDSTREFLAQAFLVLVLLYFLMASAGALSARVAEAFPQTQRGPRDAGILQTIEKEISVYLLTISLINTGLGVAVAVLMYFLSMPSPLLWGTMAGVLNFIPFVGPTVSAGIIGIVSLLTFDSVAYAVVPPALFVATTTVEGFFITPALVGRRLLLNPIAILVAIFVWSWIWGVPGALIAVPTLAILKIVCDRIETMRPLSILIDP